MLTPTAYSREPFSDDVIRDVMRSSQLLRPRSRADHRWHSTPKTGSSFLPAPRVNELRVPAMSGSGLMSALDAALRGHAAASASPRIFPFPVGEFPPGTISGRCSASRASVAAPVLGRVPLGVERMYESQKPSRFGTAEFFIRRR